jgi:hypothetical protein
MVVNIAPRTRTEVIALIDVRQSYRDYASQSKGFNVFIEEPAALPPRPPLRR